MGPDVINSHGEFALCRVTLPINRARVLVTLAEALSGAGFSQHAVEHLEDLRALRPFYLNLLAISGNLAKSGEVEIARKCFDTARYYLLGADRYTSCGVDKTLRFGDLVRAYALGAEHFNSKGCARAVRRLSRQFSKSFLTSSDECALEDAIDENFTPYGVEAIISSAGAIFHSGFTRQAYKCLEPVRVYLTDKLRYFSTLDESPWIGPGSFLSLLYYQMGDLKLSHELLQDAVTAADRIIRGYDPLDDMLGSTILDDSGHEPLYSYEEEHEEDELEFLKAHEELMQLREIGLISVEVGSKSCLGKALDLLRFNLEKIMNEIDDMSSEFDIKSQIALQCLLVEARAVEIELMSLAGIDDHTMFELIKDDLDQLLRGDERISIPYDSRSGLGSHGIFFEEVSRVLVSALYSFKACNSEYYQGCLNVASDVLYQGIESLDSVEHVFGIAFIASAVDSLHQSGGLKEEHSYSNLLAQKLKEIFFKTNGGESLSTVGTYEDPSKDLDTNRQLVAELASLGLVEAARDLAEHTIRDYRILGLSRGSSERARLESVWTDFLTGVLSPLRNDDDSNRLPKTAREWAHLSGM